MNALKVEHSNTEGIEGIDPVTIDRQCINSFQGLTKDRKKRILIIEDNRNLAELMSMIFEDDGHVETADNGSIGFGPIFDVTTGPQVFTEAFTSVFSFATELKQVSGEDAFIDALLTHYGINSNVDIWGSNETNDSDSGNLIDDVFPLYKELNVGVTERVCVNSQFDTGRDGNKLTEHRYLRFALASESPVTVTVTTVSADGTAPSSPADPTFDCTTLDPNDPLAHTYSDPDFYLWNRGDLYWIGGSCEPNAEVGTTGLLNPGTYVIDLNEFRHEDPVTVEPYPGRVCFDVTVQ